MPDCCTEDIPLLGAEGFPALWNARENLSARTGLRVAKVEHLLHRYGSLLPELLALTDDDSTLLAPLDSAPDYLKVEAVYAASAEGALHLDDILARRTRISIETWDRGLAAAGRGRRAGGPRAGLGRRRDRAGGPALSQPRARRAGVAITTR